MDSRALRTTGLRSASVLGAGLHRANYRGAPFGFAVTTSGWDPACNSFPHGQLGSGMSLDVFLSFRRCPKHLNTPPFDFGNPLRGRYGEIAKILIGGSGELKLSS